MTKKGEYEAAQQIPKGTLGTSGAGVATGPGNELSLIDLGGPEESMQPTAALAQSDPLGDFNAPGPSQSAAPAAAAQGGGLEDDLLGLSLDAQPAIRLGGEPTARKFDNLEVVTMITNVLISFSLPTWHVRLFFDSRPCPVLPTAETQL